MDHNIPITYLFRRWLFYLKYAEHPGDGDVIEPLTLAWSTDSKENLTLDLLSPSGVDIVYALILYLCPIYDLPVSNERD